MGMTLKFIEEHIPSLLKKLRNNQVWVPTSAVRLGNTALEQLNIISTTNECLFFFYQKTYTTLGRRSLRERFITPISEIAELKTRFARIDFLREKEGLEIEKHLRSVYDLSRLHRKLHLKTLNFTDIHHLLLTYKSISHLVSHFENSPISIGQEPQIQSWFQNHQNTWSADRIKTADPTLMNRTHPWHRSVFPELDEIETSWQTLVAEIGNFIKPFAEQGTPITVSPGEHFPFDFCITKKRYEKLNAQKYKFHSNSAKSTNGTLDSTEIAEFQKRGRQIQKFWSEKQDEIWAKSLDDWSASCENEVSSLPISEFITRWVGNLDAEFALARCAKEFDLVTPKFMQSATSRVSVKQLRHPIIERIHVGSPYIRHNIALGYPTMEIGQAENGLLVYGSNSSCKS